MHRDFIEAGYRVFGIQGFTDGRCNCGKEACAGKHPRAAAWQHTPEWSDEKLEQMEARGFFKSGYGVLVKGLLVIDVDARNGGVASYKKLVAAIPEIAGCGLIVNTGSGGGSQHLYFSMPVELPLSQSHKDYPGIDFKSSGFVVGPGSHHVSGNTYDLVLGGPDDIEQAPKKLVSLLKKRSKHRAQVNNKPVDISDKNIRDMLAVINPDIGYDEWVRVGMAIHHVTGGGGFKLWDDWSSVGDKYEDDDCDIRWHGFGKSPNPVGMGTLISMAMEFGYKIPVEFDVEDDVEEVVEDSGLPFNADGIDLLRPPGFVGQVCQWINDQCRYPREHLAAGTAIMAVGNLIGLRYKDDYSNVSANLFMMGVAGSATGKEAIFQAYIAILQAAGLGAVIHGRIKSDTEIIRNLVHQQMAVYMIDEFGIELQKIEGSHKVGGATHLQSVIGVLMNAYSKANGYLPLSGDVRRELEKELVRIVSLCNTKISENEPGHWEQTLASSEKQLESLDIGLRSPFISLMGFTTPSTFAGLVNGSSIESGFIGRSIIINEKETNPRGKKDFTIAKMTDQMKMALSALFSGGHSMDGGRIEHYGDKKIVKTTQDAASLLQELEDWFYNYAEIHKENSGYEAVIRRGMEMVTKISFILAGFEQLRTVEHVKWAFFFVHRDIESKTLEAYGNEKSGTHNSRKVEARIRGLIGNKDGKTSNQLARLLSLSINDVEQVLDIMRKNNDVVLRDIESKGNGKVFKKWFIR